MPLDKSMTLAIAAMSDAFTPYGTSDTRELREAYPELRFVFDGIEDMQDALEQSVPKEDYDTAYEDAWRAESIVTELRQRLDQMRRLLDCLVKFDAARPIAGELAQLQTLVSDARAWRADDA